MDDRKLEKIMRHRVKEIKGFYTHLVVYIVVNLVLVGIWFLIGGRFPWFIFALAGWGIGLFFHGYNVFVENGLLGKDWEDRKVQRLLEREKAKRGH